jgi:RNA polymerase sigma-70 factor (ECF subfamily)
MNSISETEENPQLSELEAIRGAQRGDASAFEYLYNKHRKYVFNLCLRMLRNNSDAEDLTQQIFLQLFRKINTFRGDAAFSTWLHRVTVNAVLMHLRQMRANKIVCDVSTQNSEQLEPLLETAGRDNSMLGTIERLNLMRAIRKLPAGCKRLLLLYHVLGYKHGEIAKLVGCSIGCSKSQVHRARKRLKRLLLGDEARADGDVCPVAGGEPAVT